MAKKVRKDDAAKRFAAQAAIIAAEDNAEDIVVLDLRGVSPITDYFVIATGTSSRQLQTAAEDMIDYGRKNDMKVWQVAGFERGQWIVLDFVDVVVHLFDAEHRSFYDLELIWGEAPRVQWKRYAKK
ncbi:MAG: ribosome silencing factor [Planctomycetaceae bacterium]